MKKESYLHYCYFKTVKIVQKFKIFRKFLEIAEDHTFGTEYARNLKFVSNCAVLDTLPCSTNNSISTKSGFRPFWNWTLHIMFTLLSYSHSISFHVGITLQLEIPNWILNVDRYKSYGTVCTRFIFCDIHTSSLMSTLCNLAMTVSAAVGSPVAIWLKRLWVPGIAANLSAVAMAPVIRKKNQNIIVNLSFWSHLDLKNLIIPPIHHKGKHWSLLNSAFHLIIHLMDGTQHILFSFKSVCKLDIKNA